MRKIAVFLAVMLFGITTCYAKESEVNKNEVIFELDTSITGFVIDVYNLDTGNFIERKYFTGSNMHYFYDKGLNIRITEVVTNTSYKQAEDILLYDESKTIVIDREFKDEMKVNFQTSYRNTAGFYEFEIVESDVTVYDDSFNFVTKCKGDECNEVILAPGTYFFSDNKTGLVTRSNVLLDGDYMIFRYYINGIYSEDDIEVPGSTKKGNMYYFDNYQYPEEIMIGDEVVDLADSSKYYCMFGGGVFYKYSKKDEVIDNEVQPSEDEQIDEENHENPEETNNSENILEEINSNNEIIIDVPNTQVNLEKVIFYKKKYYF